MIKVTFLGTNGWYDSPTGNTISILLESDYFYVVMDAGNGIAKLDQHPIKDREVFLFISHFHLDHVMGLHSISKNSFPGGLNLIVREGGEALLDRLLNHPFSIPMSKQSFPVKIIEVPRQIEELPFKATVLPLVHTTLTLGLRLEIEGKTITYCPDTGYCENAVNLATNTDLLITECAHKPGQINEAWPHLNPELAGRIAREAGARKLILTHFDARNYPEREMRNTAEKSSRSIFTETYSSFDDMVIEL